MDGAGGIGGRRQRLALELRRLRDQAGVTGRELAQEVGISQSKVSRIESGTAMPSVPEVRKWTLAVGAPRETGERLIELTEAAHQEVQTWRTALQEQGHFQERLRDRELRSHLVRNLQTAVVPGLLQTAEYARRVFALFELPYTDDDLSAAVAARLRRQLALYEEDRRFDFLICEGALRWRPGPARVLAAQLDRISSLSTLDNISIGIVPADAEAIALPLHGFVMYEGDDEGCETFVEVETTHARVVAARSEEVALYDKQWRRLSDVAIFDDEARAFLAALITEVRGGSR
ncbi:transcriptional regulator with XRE-family HTH domain [Thermocatellispora tengchongensis]|uniref:Transcriptional regulator with XRE-family HTH domain n=1 Tax=Thermocatellispora tengchongensis TaxID=1073253 RepID=A0A840PNL2_9ACTN|nr:helix-turn-helix transcriptional regulator [Thermocatellispora tengchongensis]MBB5138647.1 transcriptional regulator with XRE-family HTH domain [Thermocatellispora tengchongensis]